MFLQALKGGFDVQVRKEVHEKHEKLKKFDLSNSVVIAHKFRDRNSCFLRDE